MFCGSCGTPVDNGAAFCPNCGKHISAPTANPTNTTAPNINTQATTVYNTNTPSTSGFTPPASNAPKKNGKIALISTIAVICVLAIILGSIALLFKTTNSLEGTYTSLNGNWIFEIEQTDKNAGTFELYTTDGETIGENKRKSWILEDDLLTIFLGDDELYYLVVKGGIIELEDWDEEPEYADYIAPEGSTFDYEIGNYEFYEDGTYERTSSSGEYYVENNVIYCKPYSTMYSYSYGDVTITTPWSEHDYTPAFWIYDNDRIAKASDVFIKD